MRHSVYIAFGSNVGDRLHYLRESLENIKSFVKDVSTSVVIETEAILPENAPEAWDKPYLNMVAHGDTDLEPEVLLDRLQAIEQALGREREHPFWGPRTIDLDILLYDDLRVSTERLTLPHIGLKDREFLWHLLGSIRSDLKDPFTSQTFASKAWGCQQGSGVPAKRSFVLYPQLMGIVNLTPDSFSDGGLWLDHERGVWHCCQLVKDGASVVDLGAQSTRPGASVLREEAEWKRLETFLGCLQSFPVPISLDTYSPNVVKKALERYPIAWINDVTGRLDGDILREAAQAGCKICVMHSLSVPPVHNEVVENLWQTLEVWGRQQLDRLTHLGFAEENIVLDPGIGFGKTSFQTGILLRTIERMHFGKCSVLVGHSRKSFLNNLEPKPAVERDKETLAISQYLNHKVEYLRVHNVRDHQRVLSTQHWIENAY